MYEVIRRHIPAGRLGTSWTTASAPRGAMPSPARIIRHWAPWLVQMGRAPSVQEAHTADPWCFACGFGWTGRDLMRAHIRPHSRGGSAHPGNLHLLCRGCHAASEDLIGGDYWRWFAHRIPVDALIINDLADAWTTAA